MKFTSVAINKTRLSSRRLFVPLDMLLICASLLFASCGTQTTAPSSNSSSTGEQANANSTPPPSTVVTKTQSGPQLTASPNPVPLGPDFGTTNISWDTGDGSWGQVYVSVSGKPETLFMQGPKGSAEANWIGGGGTYEFRLYAGQEHKNLLASIKVNRG